MGNGRNYIYCILATLRSVLILRTSGKERISRIIRMPLPRG
jgi:hypothetical protein